MVTEGPTRQTTLPEDEQPLTELAIVMGMTE